MAGGGKSGVMSVYYGAGRYGVSGILEPFGGAIRRVFLLSFLSNMLAAMLPVFVMLLVDGKVSFSLRSGGAVNAALLASVLGLLFVLRYVRVGMVSYILFRIDSGVCAGILEKVFQMPVKRMEKKTEAFWHSVFADIDVIRNGLSGSYVMNLFDMPFVLLFVGVIGILFDRYFFVPLLFLGLSAAAVVFSIYVLGLRDDREKFALKERDELVSATIHNISSLKALSLEGRVKGMWIDYQESIIDGTYRRNYMLEVCMVIGAAIYFMGLVVFALVGLYAVRSGAMSLGAVAASLLLFGFQQHRVCDFVRYLPEYFRFINSTERLSQVMVEQVDAVKAGRVESIIVGDLSFKGATLESGQKSVILSGADFTFREGRVYVVRARNAFEGSLVLKSLMGACDLSAGRVMFDEYDVATLAPDSLKDYIHYSGENYFVVEGTIKENLNCLLSGDSASSYDGFVDYRRAAAMLGLEEAVERLPNGYGTIIDAKTDLMSREELKLLSIARVFVGLPRVMLFDQPFFGLRRLYREKLAAALEEMAACRIVIVSASGNDIARRVVVNIDDGRMTTLGPDAFDAASREIGAKIPEEGGRALFRRIFRKK